MTIVRRPSPFGEMITLRQAMDRLFDDDYRPFRFLSGGLDGPGLPLDVTTDNDKLTIEAALPGVSPEDVDITIENGTFVNSAVGMGRVQQTTSTPSSRPRRKEKK